MSTGSPSLLSRLAVLLLLVTALGLGVVTFFAMQEILLTIGAFLIVERVDGSVRQHYSLVALRNIWLIGGGTLLIVFVVGGTDYFMRRLDKPRSRRILLRILVFEILVIGAGMVIAG